MQTVFTLDAKAINSPEPLGIFFHGIGENYELFLNGRSILREAHPIQNGRLSRVKTVDGLIIIPNNLFKEGDNILSVHLYGYAPVTGLDKNRHLGLLFTDGYFIAPYTQILNARDTTVTLLLNGAIALFGLFYLFVFIKTRRYPFYLYFALFSLITSLYQFHRTYQIFDFYQDYSVKILVELVLLSITIPIGIIFVHRLIYTDSKLSLIVKVCFVWNVILMLLLVLLPHIYYRTLLRILQIGVPVFLLYASWLVGRGIYLKLPAAPIVCVKFYNYIHHNSMGCAGRRDYRNWLSVKFIRFFLHLL